MNFDVQQVLWGQETCPPSQTQNLDPLAYPAHDSCPYQGKEEDAE
jgi:hypothetical protein